jgi:predicted DNA-binding transcriptional regulator AlpA
MAKKVPYLGVNQIAKMAKVSRAVVFGAIKREELLPMNSKTKGSQRFVRQFDQKVVEEWINARKPARSLPLFEEPTRVYTERSTPVGIHTKLDKIQKTLDHLVALWS